MQKDFIPELQPLFCSRASLLQAQDKLTGNPDMDCQMRLRFADGSEVALKIKRADIENIITEHIGNIERSIHGTLDAIVPDESSTATPVSATKKESQQKYYNESVF